jgi:DNA-binding beta-propeller fold protein YncE
MLGMMAAVCLALGGASASRAASQYYFLQEIPIGGTAGSPSLTIDQETHRLYVTHSTKIEVVDLESGQASGVISNTPSVRGFAIAPQLRRGYSSNNRDGAVSVINLQTGKVTSKWSASAGAGPVLFVPGRQEIYTFNTRTPSATVFDAASGKLLANIPLAGKPQIAAADPGADRVYCNLFDKNEVAALDANSHKLVGKWPLASGKEPAGIAIDLATHSVFVGCRNKVLLMLDGLTGKVLASAAIGTGVDSAAFDPASGLVFCANSDGTTTIVHEDAPDKLSVVQTLTTERNARIMALDTKTHKIYLATTDFEAQSEPDPGTPQTRPHTLANTLKILVYGPGPAQP